MKHRSTIGWVALGLAALTFAGAGCHHEQAVPPPATAPGGMPTEAEQRMQQMSPEMRARFQQQMQNTGQKDAASTNPGNAPNPGQ